MSSLALMLMMQYLISTKAGLVNFVQGNVNVAVGDVAPAGTPIKTGGGALAEILLNPGSFMRMAENSEVVIDKAELSEIALTVMNGAVVIEASEIYPEYPVKVTTGNLSVLIVQSGVYKFDNGKATVIQGTLATADSRIPYKKGWSVVSKDNVYRSLKVAKNEPATAVEQWSETRSALLLAANVQTYQTFRRARVMTPSTSSWMWVPSFGAWTYWPTYRTRSAYGRQNYASYNYTEAVGNSNGGSRSSDSNSSGGGFGGNSGGGGSVGGGGGGGYNPAADRPTVRETIQIKNGPPGPPGGSN